LFTTGDVLSGTTSGGEHHYGVLEGWFGIHWWNGRFFVLLVTTLCVFTPLACLKRIGKQLNYQEVITGSRRLVDIWFSTVYLRTCVSFHFSLADSLSYTSTISVALAVVFVIITAGIAIIKLIGGQIPMPKLFPTIPDLASVWELFTAVPVLVTAYVCHYNGMSNF
jgi:sodium-coupled neutral amino acid transporter 2